MRRHAAVSVLILAALLLVDPANRAGPLASVSGAVLHALIPFVSFEKEFRMVAGKDRGRVVTLSSRPDPTNDKQSQFTFGDYATVHMTRNSRGILLLERLDLIKSRSFVIYDPALPVLPVDFTAAAPFVRQTQYRMYANESGRLKRSGRVTHTVQSISPSRLDTPAGPMDGFLIQMEHRMEMEYMSELRISLGLGCREGEGPVFGSGQYKITRLGVFSEIKNAAAGLLSR